MWGLLISAVMAAILGIIGDDMPGGVLGSIVAGFAGAWLGALLFGGFGPVIGGFAVVPALLGTVIFISLLGLVSRLLRRAV